LRLSHGENALYAFHETSRQQQTDVDISKVRDPHHEQGN